MKNKLIALITILLTMSPALSGCDAFYGSKIRIAEIKMAKYIDANIMPVEATGVFPKGTAKVYCWFKWKDAEINSQITAKWLYVTENINILSYPVIVPRRSGAGSVALTMPKGKVLPSGSYRIDLILDGRKLKSCKFRVD